MHHISSRCDLITEDGECVDSSHDSKVEFHFNALLDAIADQRTDSSEDKSLEGIMFLQDDNISAMTHRYTH